MDALPVTSSIAAVLAIMMLPLTMQVSIRRAVLGKAAGEIARYTFGDGNDELLRRRVRAFGNFAEYTPMCLIMLALSELGSAPAALLWTIGTLLVSGRALHALGMLYADSPLPRGVAMMMTYLAIAGPASWLLYHSWS